jgi:hypothetical protein
MAAVQTLKWYPEKKRKLLFMKPTDNFKQLLISYYFDVSYGTRKTSPMGSMDPYWDRKKKWMENKRFRQKARLFARALAQFKYVLQSIADPTLVFLISEGFSKEKGVTTFKRKYDLKSMSLRGAFREFSLYYLHRIINGVNTGGSVLYTINPQLTNPGIANPLSDGGALSMRYAAEASGGRYFEGENVEAMVKEIKKYTAAYYELGVSYGPELGQRQRIRVKCSRKGIRLHTIRQSEGPKPYHKMTKIEKKLFAYNAISGGTWSRITGKVKPADYKVEENQEKTLKILDIAIPENMRNRKVDVFLLQFDPKTKDLAIDLKSRTAKERERIRFKTKQNKEHYFVFIEPVKTLCIYGDEKNTTSFYTFFHRFKRDKEFQRSRVIFPFKRQRFNPDSDQLLRTDQVLQSQWEFTTFQDLQAYSWSEPQVRENEAVIRLTSVNGNGIHLVVFFKRMNGKWYLEHSEDRSREKSKKLPQRHKDTKGK